MALTEAAQEVIYLRRLLASMGIEPSGPTTIYEDNQSCIKFVANQKFSSRSKHIDVKRRFVEESVAKQNLKLTYVPSQDNIADMLTKPLPPATFGKLRDQIISAS